MSNGFNKRSLSPINLLFISFTAIFGSGWLFAPLYAAQIAGPGSLLAWLLGAVMAAVIGVTIAEVISRFPKVGGLNRVAYLSHGECLAFILTVLNLLVFIILPALEVRAVLQYLSSQIPGLIGQGGNLSASGYLLSILLLALASVANLFGTRTMAWFTSVSVFFKMLTPCLVCASFIWAVRETSFTQRVSWVAMFDTPWESIFQAIAVSGIIFSYNGFSQATVFGGEAQNPKRAIPFAILGSLLISAALYILIQYAFLVALPSTTLANGWKQLSFPGAEGPFSGVAALLGLHWLLGMIYTDAVVSPMGTAFAYSSSAPRLLYALSENLNAWVWLRRLNTRGVPVASIVFSFGFQALAFWMLPSLKAMIAILVAAFILCYTVAPAILLRIRAQLGEQPAVFRVPFYRLTCFLSISFSNLMVFACGWEALRNLGLTCVALIGIYWGVRRKSGKSLSEQMIGSEWFLFQAFCIVWLSFLKEKQCLSFSTSASLILGVSAVALILSQLRAPPMVTGGEESLA